MNTLPFHQFAVIFCLVFIFTSCTNSGPDTVVESLPTKTVLSNSNNQTFYHYDGVGNTARAVSIQRNSDGSATIVRMDVALSLINESVDFVALNGENYDSNTHSIEYKASNTPLWYIPFGNDPIQQMGTEGQTVTALCDCKSSEGFCMVMNGPDDHNGAKWTSCAASPDCYSGCYGFTNFSVSGNHPAGISLRATQVAFQ